MALQGNLRSGWSKAAGPTALTGELAAGLARPHKPTETQPVGVKQPADAAAAGVAASREVASAPAATSAEPMRAEAPVGSSSAAPQARGQKRKAMDGRAAVSDPEVNLALWADVIPELELLSARICMPTLHLLCMSTATQGRGTGDQFSSVLISNLQG